MQQTKAERLKEFISRFTRLPRASNFEEARTQLISKLNEVEDELSGVPYNPDTLLNDGRMYPPQDDNVKNVPGHPHLKRLRSKDHNTYIRDNGATKIVTISTGIVILDKPGSNGLRVDDD